jgi:hypothetical protein
MVSQCGDRLEAASSACRQHGIMRGAIYTVDPDYRKAVEDAYAAARKQGLPSAQGYAGNNFNEYWATGIEAYVFGSGRNRDWLLAADPRLYELVRQVIPGGRMPGNVYVGHQAIAGLGPRLMPCTSTRLLLG